MNEVYIKTITMVAIIALGYLLHALKVFCRDDAKTISKIMMNITLPAVTIKNLNGISLSRDILIAVLMGFVVNAFFFAMVFVFSKKEDVENRIVTLFSFCSFNIGSYGIPVLSTFVTSEALAGVLAFNYPGTGVFTYCVPTTMGNTLYGEKSESFMKSVGKSVTHNVPAITCLSMLMLSFFHITLPNGVAEFFGTLSNANTVLAMLSIGILLNFNFPRKEIMADLQIAFLRLAFAIISSVSIMAFLPATESLRKALALVVFTPIASSMPIMALHCGYSGSRVATINSIYLIISIISMTLLIPILY